MQNKLSSGELEIGRNLIFLEQLNNEAICITTLMPFLDLSDLFL